MSETVLPLSQNAQRLWDLVRYQRRELHVAELITDEECAALAADHGAVARLEDYDRKTAAPSPRQALTVSW
jgi:hypothetical protein